MRGRDVVAERGLPVALDIERLLLGAVLLDGGRFSEIAADVNTEDFATEAHRVIWARMATLAERSAAIDRFTLATEMHSRGELEAVGGLTYLATLDEGMPALSNLDSYTAIVREKSQLRQVISAAQHAINQATVGEESAATIGENFSALISQVQQSGQTGFVTVQELVERAGGTQGYVDRRRSHGLPYPPALPTLQEMTGGMRPGEFIVIAGETGGGKSALALQIALHAGLAGDPAAIFSLEMGAEEVADRMICSSGGINTREMRNAKHDGAEGREKLRKAVNAAVKSGAFIADKDRATVPAIIGQLRRLKARQPIGLAVVDYLQLCSGSTGKNSNRAEEVASVTRGLKRMAGELKIPVIALSQFNRENAKAQRKPALHDLRESGTIEQDANLVLLLHFTKRYDLSVGDVWAEGVCIIGKQRGGPIGEFPIYFHAPTGRFYEPGTRQEAA